MSDDVIAGLKEAVAYKEGEPVDVRITQIVPSDSKECCCERLGVALGLLIFVDSVLSIMFGPNYIPGPEYAPGAGKVVLALIIFCGTLYFYKRKRRFLNRRRKWVS